MGLEWPDDDEPTEEELARLRKRANCWHEWPEGADETEVGCINCGYVAMKTIAANSPEGRELLRQFLQSKPEDYIQLVAPVPPEMSEAELAEDDLIEKLAYAEHAGWAHWMTYLFSLCTPTDDGALIIPAASVKHWQRQIETDYDELTPREQDSDRDEVQRILPCIREYAARLNGDS